MRLPRVATWDRDKHWSVLTVTDHRGRAWQVSAWRDGAWKIKSAPSQYDDDPRRYAEGDVHDSGVNFANSNEVFRAAKKTARKYLADLLIQIAEEERAS